MEKREVSEETPLAEVLKIPGAIQVLIRNNFPCVTCPLALFEAGTMTVGEVARMYGLDVEKIVRELRELAGGERKQE
jgi:hypothetical protein